MHAALQKKANENLAESSGEVTTEGIPGWIPGLPSAIPFTWCLKNIPLADDICTYANSPVTTHWFNCNGTWYYGTVISAGIGYGPSVSVSGDQITGNVQHQANVDLFYDPDNDCFAVKFSSGGVEGCVGEECVPNLPSPTASITKLANALYDVGHSLATGMYDQLGYTPSSEVIVATAVFFAVVLAFGVAAGAPAGV